VKSEHLLGHKNYLVLTIPSISGNAHTRKIVKSSHTWLHYLNIWAFNNSNCRSMIMSVRHQNHISDKQHPKT
jgi:hypothetical protein